MLLAHLTAHRDDTFIPAANTARGPVPQPSVAQPHTLQGTEHLEEVHFPAAVCVGPWGSQSAEQGKTLVICRVY